MRLIFKILLIPVAIISILIGVIKGVFGAKHLKYIPMVIQKLAKDGAAGTAIAELKFPQVLAYAEEKGVIFERDRDSFSFLITISGEMYSVGIVRAPDGSNCAVFRCSQLASSTRPIESKASALMNGAENGGDNFGGKTKAAERHGADSIPEDINMPSVITALDEAYKSHSNRCSW